MLKLNKKRTFLIGFAFFGILLLWQVYDSWCPTFLTDIFARRMYNMSSAELKAGDADKILNVQWIVGIIMACDNLAAVLYDYWLMRYRSVSGHDVVEQLGAVECSVLCSHPYA